MTILIDSNIIIGYLKGNENIIAKISDIIKQNIPIFIPTISIYEIYLGIVANLYLKEGRPNLVPKLLKDYNQLIQTCNILEFNRVAAEKAADLYAHAQGKGITIKQNDCMIAGIALNAGISNVFTNDKSDFEKIKKISGLNFITVETS